ncbi:MAG: phosphatase PAP2 family protein [Verrucomicrobia bacterium]|nr:phosphatase PAP2 family protein [Verrucomicrobiota bacterium]
MSNQKKHSQASSKINYKILLFIHILVSILISSLFYSISKGNPITLDKKCFQLLNSWIQNSSFWQTFWAMANHRMADWVTDACFLLFFYWIVKASPKTEQIRKAAECLFFLLYSAIIILLTNELLFRGLLHIHRNSPTLVIDSFVNLSEKVTWLKVKFKSPKSFPGDHATLYLLFIASFLYLARKNIKITVTAILYGIFLCLPRLIAGAHWVTDILVGSGSIVIIFFSWAFCTPLASICIQKIENILRLVLSAKTKRKDLSDA